VDGTRPVEVDGTDAVEVVDTNTEEVDDTRPVEVVKLADVGRFSCFADGFYITVCTDLK
jgi:hypothetical protein